VFRTMREDVGGNLFTTLRISSLTGFGKVVGGWRWKGIIFSSHISINASLYGEYSGHEFVATRKTYGSVVPFSKDLELYKFT
jgi:hypothetical protein